MKMDIITNLERVRAWKSRIINMRMKREDVASHFNCSKVTVTRWTNPDKYGLPPAAVIDLVELELHKLEKAYAKKKKPRSVPRKRTKTNAHKRNER